MAGIAVAVDAQEHLASGFGRQHLMHEVRMAVQARVLRHAPVPRFDLDRFMEILQREGERMKEAVVCLGDPFAERMVREVAIITRGYMFMTARLPRVIVVVHDVAVGAGGRVIRQIRQPATVAEREHADAGADSQSDDCCE